MGITADVGGDSTISQNEEGGCFGWAKQAKGCYSILGMFLVKTNNAYVPVKRDNSMNTYSRISSP